MLFLLGLFERKYRSENLIRSAGLLTVALVETLFVGHAMPWMGLFILKLFLEI